MIGNFPYVAVVVLISLGIYTIIFKKNLIKIAIGISLIECGANLFLITLGYRKGAVAPIYTMAPEGTEMVLPTPQALTLTSNCLLV
jgi:multicomponent Na+:H+ antiporter subunit C